MYYGIEALQQEQQEEILRKYLTFEVDGQEYGFSIDDVIEIIQAQKATVLPELPPYAKGVINLRGRVIPLIDVNLRFGKEEKAYTDRTCIVIASILLEENQDEDDALQVGFIVDTVEDVIDMRPEDISAPPALSADPAGRYLTGIAKLPDGMVLLLSPKLLLSDDDITKLAAAAK